MKRERSQEAQDALLTLESYRHLVTTTGALGLAESSNAHVMRLARCAKSVPSPYLGPRPGQALRS